MDRAERQTLADEFEAVRAPGLSIADAAARFKARTADLEWALWATEPDTDRAHGVNFDADYADRALEVRGQDWRRARDDLRHELEQHAERFR